MNIPTCHLESSSKLYQKAQVPRREGWGHNQDSFCSSLMAVLKSQSNKCQIIKWKQVIKQNEIKILQGFGNHSDLQKTLSVLLSEDFWLHLIKPARVNIAFLNGLMYIIRTIKSYRFPFFVLASKKLKTEFSVRLLQGVSKLGFLFKLYSYFKCQIQMIILSFLFFFYWKVAQFLKNQARVYFFYKKEFWDTTFQISHQPIISLPFCTHKCITTPA